MFVISVMCNIEAEFNTCTSSKKKLKERDVV